MGLKVTKFVWAHSKHKGTRLLLLLAIADFINNDNGECTASATTLGAMCNISERQVRTVIDSLVVSGELLKVERTGKTAVLRVAGYSLASYEQAIDNSEKLCTTPEVLDTDPGSFEHPTPEVSALTPEVLDTDPGSPLPTNPLTKEQPNKSKPKKEPSARKRTDTPLPDNTAGILQEWWQCTPATHRPAKCRDNERSIYAVKGWRAQAQSLAEHGVTRRDVAAFVPYWLDKRPDETLNFGNLANDIIAWKQKHGPPDTDGKRYVNGRYADFIDS